MKRKLRRWLPSLLLLGLSGLGMYNVYSDNADVEAMAKRLACGDEQPECTAGVSRMQRTPIAQSFEISTDKRKVDVKCVRGAYLVGAYTCQLQ